MPGIFISYRREDSFAYARGLCDRLSAHFGKECVFMDVDAIEPGVDFVETIQRRVASCDVLVAVIGRQWLTSMDEQGQRRLDNPEDFARLEIAAALDRNIRVIPVLVGGAHIPRSQDLPEALASLARRNALEIADATFHQGVSRLIEVLGNVLGDRENQNRKKDSKAYEEEVLYGVPERELRRWTPRLPWVALLFLYVLTYFTAGLSGYVWLLAQIRWMRRIDARVRATRPSVTGLLAALVISIGTWIFYVAARGAPMFDRDSIAAIAVIPIIVIFLACQQVATRRILKSLSAHAPSLVSPHRALKWIPYFPVTVVVIQYYFNRIARKGSVSLWPTVKP